MKLVNGKTGLALRLGVLVTAMLFGQQAMAVGTRAGTDIDNTALVDYEVAGIGQSQLSASVSFVVDRRVDFNINVTDPANLAPVTPGGTDYFVEFTLTNTSNGVLDFSVLLAQMVGGVVGGSGQTDDTDMALVDWAVGTSGANGDAPPVRGINDVWIDELEADDFIRIHVFGDAALAMLNAQVAGVQIDIQGTQGGALGVEGGAINDTDPPTDGGIENVFANAAGGNLEVAQDGFEAVSAALTVVKSFAVIAGDLGSGLAIPGATVEYTVDVINASPFTTADAVLITDLIDSDVTFLPGQYAGGTDFEIDNGGAVSQCTAAGDGDDCELVGTTVTIGAAGTISVAAATTLTLTYQVTIPDPPVTP